MRKSLQLYFGPHVSIGGVSFFAEKKVIFHLPCHTNASPSNFIDFMALFAGNDITSSVREKRSLVK